MDITDLLDLLEDKLSAAASATFASASQIARKAAEELARLEADAASPGASTPFKTAGAPVDSGPPITSEELRGEYFSETCAHLGLISLRVSAVEVHHPTPIGSEEVGDDILSITVPLRKAIDETSELKTQFVKLCEDKSTQKEEHQEYTRLDAATRILSPSLLFCLQHGAHMGEVRGGIGPKSAAAVEAKFDDLAERAAELERTLVSSRPALKSSRQEVRTKLCYAVGKAAFLRRLQRKSQWAVTKVPASESATVDIDWNLGVLDETKDGLRRCTLYEQLVTGFTGGLLREAQQSPSNSPTIYRRPGPPTNTKRVPLSDQLLKEKVSIQNKREALVAAEAAEEAAAEAAPAPSGSPSKRGKKTIPLREGDEWWRTLGQVCHCCLQRSNRAPPSPSLAPMQRRASSSMQMATPPQASWHHRYLDCPMRKRLSLREYSPPSILQTVVNEFEDEVAHLNSIATVLEPIALSHKQSRLALATIEGQLQFISSILDDEQHSHAPMAPPALPPPPPLPSQQPPVTTVAGSRPTVGGREIAAFEKAPSTAGAINQTFPVDAQEVAVMERARFSMQASVTRRIAYAAAEEMKKATQATLATTAQAEIDAVPIEREAPGPSAAQLKAAQSASAVMRLNLQRGKMSSFRRISKDMGFKPVTDESHLEAARAATAVAEAEEAKRQAEEELRAEEEAARKGRRNTKRVSIDGIAAAISPSKDNSALVISNADANLTKPPWSLIRSVLLMANSLSAGGSKRPATPDDLRGACLSLQLPIQGMDSQAHLIWLAVQYLNAPLPVGWLAQRFDADGDGVTGRRMTSWR